VKIIGRVADSSTGANGRDLIVVMPREEWENWRALTGPHEDGDLKLDTAIVEAFQQFRYAMREAATAMGQRLVPAAAVLSHEATHGICEHDPRCPAVQT
jgi:hypothetical protein